MSGVIGFNNKKSGTIGPPAGEMIFGGILFIVQPTVTSSASAYNNNKTNFIQGDSGWSKDIVTKFNNSKIWIKGQHVVSGDTSHTYTDILRTVGGSTYWVAAYMDGDVSGNDGLYASHQTSDGDGDTNVVNVVDEPNQPAGTTINYKLYNGLWGGGTCSINKYMSGSSANDNQNITTHYYYWEIVT